MLGDADADAQRIFSDKLKKYYLLIPIYDWAASYGLGGKRALVLKLLGGAMKGVEEGRVVLESQQIEVLERDNLGVDIWQNISQGKFGADILDKAEAVMRATYGKTVESNAYWVVLQELRKLMAAAPVKDKAMMTKPSDVGGIDLNPAKLDIQSEGQDIQMNVPAMDPKMFEGPGFKGLTPFIIQIVPVTNLPLLFGTSQPAEEEKLSMR